MRHPRLTGIVTGYINIRLAPLLSNGGFVQEFLIWLEETCGCSKQTQRQRLTAIRSFIQYGGILDVCTVAIQADVEKN